VQAYLKGSRIVKALSHMGYHNLFDDTRPVGSNDRKVIAIAGDNIADNKLVSKLIDDLGFDPIIIGELSAGKFLEPGSSMFGASVTDKEVHNLLPLARSN
jgi:predicted dinucleotide-binding enzyme